MDQKAGIIKSGKLSCLVLFLASVTICTRVSALASGGRSRTAYDYDGDLSNENEDLILVEEMKGAKLQSTDKLQLRCKVSDSPEKNVTFTWYHNNKKLDPNDDHRISIKPKDWGSLLQILEVYTADSGNYRCEASDREKSVSTEAYVDVGFNRPPPGGKENHDSDVFQPKCEKYKGNSCKEYLGKKKLYLESFQDQTEPEARIAGVLDIIGKEDLVSKTCAKYARKAVCSFVFPLCDTEVRSGETKRPVELCREDCELLQYDVCASGLSLKNRVIQSLLSNVSNCDKLPRTTAIPAKCSRSGLESVVDRSHLCYNDSGASYKGVAAVAETGEACKPWPTHMLPDFPQLLAGGHNFCRNPGKSMDKPWCFVDENKVNRVACDVQECKIATASSDLLIILIPCVSVLLFGGCIAIVVCIVCKKNNKTKHTAGKKVEMRQVIYKKTAIPELPAAMVHFSVELGEGKYGKVFKAQIMNNTTYSPTEPVAVKTVIAGAVQAQINDFQREMEMYADLQHINVSCLKACVKQPTLRCMIFEYTSRVDLHEFLTLHSPHSDIGGGKMSGSVSSHTSSSLEEGDFLHMSVQVASGLEYLATQSFIHRDLAARNILVCSNNIMKISNLGVVRDCYLSSYYRSPQGGHMLPVRWMAPESLTANMYSDKSVIWSFGVMVWEMFTYGQQPYCGYSNHEVIDMISKGQTLTCPDQCSSRVYAFLRECWSNDPNKRPNSKELRAKLSGWEGASTTRMTSQLAQGVHRQLNSVMREGTQFQYSPPQGTVIDGFGQPYLAAQRQPEHHLAAPVGQSYYSSPSPSSSGVVSHAPPSYPSYVQQPQAFPPAQMYPQQQMHPQQPMHVQQQMHPQQQIPYSRPHPGVYPTRSNPTHSSRSSDSGGSSVRNQMHSGYRVPSRSSNSGQVYTHPPSQQQHFQPPEQQQYENAHGTPDSGVHSSKSMVQPQVDHEDEYHHRQLTSNSPLPPPVMQRSRPGSELVGSGLEPMVTPSTSNLKPVVAPKPPLSPYDHNRARGNIMMGINGQRNRNHNENIDLQETRNASTNGDNYTGKTMSCDSGLPTEDGETDSGENQPFLSKPTSSSPPNKSVPQISGSMSSTMSGSTAGTAESRLTA